MSKEKLKELERELEELRTVKRKEIAEDLKYAKSLGDLSENAEYHEARNSQAIMESRIIELENMIKNAEIVVPHHSEAVEIGSVVTVLKENNQKSKNTYEIVGSGEADTAAGKISNESPLGQAMMGRKKGEEFEFETPGGKVSYTVLDVE